MHFIEWDIRINYGVKTFHSLAINVFIYNIFKNNDMLHINNDNQTYLNFKSNFPSIRPCFSFVYSPPSRPTLIVFTSFKSAARGLFQFLTLQWDEWEGEPPFAIVVFLNGF